MAIVQQVGGVKPPPIGGEVGGDREEMREGRERGRLSRNYEAETDSYQI